MPCVRVTGAPRSPEEPRRGNKSQPVSLHLARSLSEPRGTVWEGPAEPRPPPEPGTSRPRRPLGGGCALGPAPPSGATQPLLPHPRALGRPGSGTEPRGRALKAAASRPLLPPPTTPAGRLGPRKTKAARGRGVGRGGEGGPGSEQLPLPPTSLEGPESRAPPRSAGWGRAPGSRDCGSGAGWVGARDGGPGAAAGRGDALPAGLAGAGPAPPRAPPRAPIPLPIVL